MFRCGGVCAKPCFLEGWPDCRSSSGSKGCGATLLRKSLPGEGLSCDFLDLRRRSAQGVRGLILLQSSRGGRGGVLCGNMMVLQEVVGILLLYVVP